MSGSMNLRTNMPSFGKRTPFGDSHLKPFEAVFGDSPYGNAPRQQGEWSFNAEEIDAPDTAENDNVDDRLITSRWRVFTREWIRDTKGDSLDILLAAGITAVWMLPTCQSHLCWPVKR
ncbi:N-6 DNA methylase [Klebsiella michiganensis]|uniref:N-6 DNA methylase n=1 Tax=Klebsiella michiganensis TaxID=1134687 RepID=A0A7H4M107_9ENTR|nr:N-6 DNA methylase [Klebsiella michiganensis]